MQSTAKLLLILAVLATALTALGTFSKGWRSAEMRTRELNIGLRTWEECHKGECESASWSEVKGKAGRSTAATLGPIAFFVGLVTALVLALLAGAVMFSPAHVRTLAPIAMFASAAFLGMSVMYALSFPSGFAPIGWSAYAAWLGCALGVGAGATARKLAPATA